MPLQHGKRLGPYEILSPIGAGGMGEVYRARDIRLGREVAIKVLPTHFSADAQRLRRFEQEAKAASALNHPNILTVHDVGTQDQVPYVVSELLEGETLRQRLATGSLSQYKVIDFALQIARGLSAAHEKGIVHRDLKPENLFVTSDERIKILDFGLAKLASPGPAFGMQTQASTLGAETEPGKVLGTMGYMSPEQVRGQPVDPRSDIFAFGTNLYEMLSGRRAFHGESAADTMTAILKDDPLEIIKEGCDFPPALERIMRRCLEKKPGLRFQTARDLGFTLELVSGSSSGFERKPADSPQDDDAADRKRSIAVMPFRNLTSDPESAHLGIGLADATITELAHVKSFLVRPTTTILRYQSRIVTPEQAGRELGVDAVVEASFQRSGPRLRATVQLIGTVDGRPLWGTKVDTSFDDIFRMQDEVSRKIAEALEVELTPADERRLSRAVQPAGSAYDFYLKGKIHLLRETVPQINAAVECFEKARDADPGSALTWAGLSAAYARMAFTFEPEGDWHRRAEETCEKALALDSWLPEGRYLRGFLAWSPQGHWDHATAIRELMGAIAGRPSLTEAHDRLGVVLFHLSMFEEATFEFEQALAINPRDEMAATHLASCCFLQGRYQEAMDRLEVIMRETPWPWATYQLAHSQVRLGLMDAAGQAIDLGSLQLPGDVLFYPIRGVIAASLGDAARAREEVQLTIRNAKAYGHYHHAQYDVACIHALLGDGKRALEWLRRAAGNGYPCHEFFERDPLLRSLRDEKEFVLLVDELATECEAYRKIYSELRALRSDSL